MHQIGNAPVLYQNGSSGKKVGKRSGKELVKLATILNPIFHAARESV